jgi:hypothetical protein
MTITFAQATRRALERTAARSGVPNPTGAPVLRGSLEEGTFEHRFYRAYQPKETDKLRKAANEVSDMFRFERRNIRANGEQAAVKTKLPPLSPSAVRVYAALCEIGRTCKGEIRPSYDYLANKLVLGRATIARALKQLKEAGFLTIQRRCKRVEREGPGPRFKQTSNAYRLDWPSRLAQWLGYKHVPCPLPDDEAHRLEERLSAFTRTASVKVDNVLEDVLERLERMFEERESHNDTQPLCIDNIRRKKGRGLVGHGFNPDG